MALPAKRARRLIDLETPPELPEGLIKIINEQIESDCRKGNSSTYVTFKTRANDVEVQTEHQRFLVQNMEHTRLRFNIHCVYSREYVVEKINSSIIIMLPISDATLFSELAWVWGTDVRSVVYDLMFLATEYKIDVDDILRAMGTPEVARGIYMARELQIRRDVTKQKLAPLLQKLARDLVWVMKSFL